MEAPAIEQPEQTVYRIASRLVAIQHAVAKMTGGSKVNADPRALEQAVFQIRAILRSIDGAYGVIIGGLAVQENGYHRYTEDVDVVVDDLHFGQVMAKLREAGYAIMPDFSFENIQTKVKLDLLREGKTLYSAKLPLPHPSELGPNGWFATLPGLVRLKLDGARLQDKADIVELLKRKIDQADIIDAKLPDIYRAEYRALVAQARSELSRPQISPL